MPPKKLRKQSTERSFLAKSRRVAEALGHEGGIRKVRHSVLPAQDFLHGFEFRLSLIKLISLGLWTSNWDTKGWLLFFASCMAEYTKQGECWNSTVNYPSAYCRGARVRIVGLGRLGCVALRFGTKNSRPEPLSKLQATSPQDMCGLPDQQAVLVAKVQETRVLCRRE